MASFLIHARYFLKLSFCSLDDGYLFIWLSGQGYAFSFFPPQAKHPLLVMENMSKSLPQKRENGTTANSTLHFT